jgi:hypothetical protein
MKFKIVQFLLTFTENACYTVAGVVSCFLEKSPCVPVPIASAIYTVIGCANVASTASATFVTSSAVHSFARALLSHAWRRGPGSPAGPRFALPRPFPIRP